MRAVSESNLSKELSFVLGILEAELPCEIRQTTGDLDNFLLTSAINDGYLSSAVNTKGSIAA